MTAMENMPTFKDFIFQQFVEWEKNQPKKRSFYSAFARWLSDNSYGIIFKQQLISDWINGKYVPRDEMYILVLAEKLGNQVYKILEVEPIDPLRIYVLRNWKNAPKKIQIELAKTISKHSSDPLPNEATEHISPKQK